MNCFEFGSLTIVDEGRRGNRVRPGAKSRLQRCYFMDLLSATIGAVVLGLKGGKF